VRTTERKEKERSLTSRFTRQGIRLAIAFMVSAALSGVSGCAGGSPSGKTAGSLEETSSAHMTAAVGNVNVTQEMIESRPKASDQSTPESAVRSYLDWVSYAYRIAKSDVAAQTATEQEMVRVDSYVQYNLEMPRIIDQTLESIAFGKVVTKDRKAVVPAMEKWSYRYVSIETAGKTLEGPHEASYDTTYTLVKTDKGVWVVDSVDAKALGKVK